MQTTQKIKDVSYSKVIISIFVSLVLVFGVFGIWGMKDFETPNFNPVAIIGYACYKAFSLGLPFGWFGVLVSTVGAALLVPILAVFIYKIAK